LAGFLIALWGGQDYRGPFALIAVLLLAASLGFHFGVKAPDDPRGQ
jgi:hypothetical protein